MASLDSPADTPSHTETEMSFYQNLYSRRKASIRRIINEHEVIAWRPFLAFVVYTLEEMSFSEQVRLFFTS